MATTFTGVDPNSTRTGTQAQADLSKAIGRPLTAQDLDTAFGVLGPMGYTDRSGAASMTGTQYNALLQKAAELTPGATFAAWQAPPATPAGPAATPPAPTEAPAYTAPTLNLPDAYVSPDPFAFDAWRPTTAADLETDPSYQNRLAESQKALERSRAAQGILRTGGTMAELVREAQNYAANEFSNVDARRRADYTTQYGVAKDIYTTNTGEGRYAYEQGVGRAKDVYGAAVDKAEAEYAPRAATWQAQREDAHRADDRAWQTYLYTNDDAYRRERAAADDAYRDRTYDTDDAFRRWLEERTNNRFLAELGTRP